MRDCITVSVSISESLHLCVSDIPSCDRVTLLVKCLCGVCGNKKLLLLKYSENTGDSFLI